MPDSPEPRPNYKMAKDKAEEVLAQNHVQGPPVRVDKIVEAYGLTVRQITFTGKYAAVAGFIDLGKQEIVVNAKDAVNRQTFTLAHELAHWLLHRKDLEQNPQRSILLRRPIGKVGSDPSEKEANCFAANLLVPDRFLDSFPGVDPQRLAKMFLVSPDVMGYRLDARREG